MRRKVLLVGAIHRAGSDLLEARDDVEVEVLPLDQQEGLMQAVRGAHGIIVRTARIDQPVIDVAQSLEVVSRHGVGYDSVDVEALTRRGIPLTIAIGGNAVSVAEHTMFLLLALAKRGGHYDRATRTGDWAARNTMGAFDVEGKSLLIIGFGRIGSRVAPRALAFGMRVFAYDPYVDQGVIERAGCAPVADYRAALPRMDAVTVHTPFTAETRAMIGAAELARMKPSAVLVNCARGGIIDEPALVAALERGAIGGVGLDVFVGEPEPPRADNPLFRFDNVITSPHTAGVSIESMMRMAEISARNVLDCFDGKLDPAMVVNPEVLAVGRTRDC